MSRILDTVLLLALPASGKSEVRKYLKSLSPEECARDFHMGPTVQLDDFPYVHVMRRVDDELAARREPRLFFEAPDRSFRDPRQWGALIALVNEDHADLVARRAHRPASAAAALLDRLDAAAATVGAPRRLASLPAATREALSAALEAEAAELLREKHAGYPDTLGGKTLVIEFARGGAQGATMPLLAPFGYRYSLALLSPAILERAVVLYIWVTPEESRRKNEARADPNDPGSILHHSVPAHVMRADYGCDDMDWLEAESDRPGTLRIEAHGGVFHLPVARFDNRVDKTSFLRGERAAWRPEEIRGVHEGLRGALSKLAAARG
jgi:hypothetical protein